LNKDEDRLMIETIVLQTDFLVKKKKASGEAFLWGIAGIPWGRDAEEG